MYTFISFSLNFLKSVVIEGYGFYKESIVIEEILAG